MLNILHKSYLVNVLIVFEYMCFDMIIIDIKFEFDLKYSSYISFFSLFFWREMLMKENKEDK